MKMEKGSNCARTRTLKKKIKKTGTNVTGESDTRDTIDWNIWSPTQMLKTDTSKVARVNLKEP